MDKSDMLLLDLSNNKLTILPNLLVWRSEVASAFHADANAGSGVQGPAWSRWMQSQSHVT